MNIVPKSIQEKVDRIDRTRSLAIGISTGLTALWSIYRVLWLIYAATTLSSVGVSTGSLVFPYVLWTVVGVAAAFAAYVFLLRYAKQP
jgi:hypothetical protein